MEKIIKIAGKEYGLRANARTVRMYRDMIGNDLMRDIAEMQKGLMSGNGSYEPAENLAFVMAFQYAQYYGNEFPKTVDDWFEDLPLGAAYDLVRPAMELWRANEETTSEAKKK